MKKPVTNLPASVRDRLARTAKERGLIYQQALSYYAIERLLSRMAVSEYCEFFVLKGGLIFIAHGLPLRRPTRDIDLHSVAANSVDQIKRIFRYRGCYSLAGSGHCVASARWLDARNRLTRHSGLTRLTKPPPCQPRRL